MCTVSIITTPAGFRVVVNRDEERDRPPAHEPRWRDLREGVRAIWPVDPLGGGTWVGACMRGESRAGAGAASSLVLCLLNGNPEPRPVRPDARTVLSRGVIIPALLSCDGAERAIHDAQAMELDRFPPFRLVGVDLDEQGRTRVVDLEWNGRDARTSWSDGRAACFVSSGLGDRCVAVRLPLFEQMVRSSPSAVSQDRFHAHRWPERPELSVLMSRSAARTVSRTIVEATPNGVHMSYQPIAETPAVPHEPSAKRRARS